MERLSQHLALVHNKDFATCVQGHSLGDVPHSVETRLTALTR
jgi:hypothetical protein